MKRILIALLLTGCAGGVPGAPEPMQVVGSRVGGILERLAHHG